MLLVSNRVFGLTRDEGSTLHHGASVLRGGLASIVQLLFEIEAVFGAFFSVDGGCTAFVVTWTHHLVSLISHNML